MHEVGLAVRGSMTPWQDVIRLINMWMCGAARRATGVDVAASCGIFSLPRSFLPLCLQRQNTTRTHLKECRTPAAPRIPPRTASTFINCTLANLPRTSLQAEDRGGER
ncbi:hypothetical protein E2C01_036424 [Portunus trituberculatus]|uniref:Uncharacterized protein n=1 Tax=Portunus trituberculatus TaxID=210409 RepID=A0A5B7FCE9_PORTR|nr:hypothetical protein [Portunus trituberculatus]